LEIDVNGALVRVLLVDDDEDDYRLIREMLAEVHYPKYDLEWVGTYESGLAAIGRHEHEVYLLDYRLEARDGLELLQEAVRGGCRAPLILLTGQGDRDIDLAAMSAGAADFLPKDQLCSALLERSIRYALDRKRSSEALLESNARFQAIFDGAAIGIGLADLSGRLLTSNLSFQRLVGCGAEELRRREIAELTHPDDAAVFQELYRQLTMGKREQFQMEKRYIHKDGSLVWARATASLVRDAAGEPAFAIIMAEDVTLRREAEESLNATAVEFRIARTMQRRLFPTASPNLPGFDLGGVSYAAEATGGDYFDYIPLANDCVGIAIGDVSGHGFGPALLMAVTRTYLRAFAQVHDDVGGILNLANHALVQDTSEDRYVTLLLARLDPRARSLEYVSAGHLTGYVMDAEGAIKMQLPSTGLPLGISPESSFRASPPLLLEPGDLVLFLTDGVVEARTPFGATFGARRAQEIVRIYRRQPALEIADNLFHAVRAFSQETPQIDDITAVILKAEEEPTAKT
jgi:PAS domain S-box-containing protein